jgi:hypothetical protein
MNFWISSSLVEFSVFMASTAKEIYLVMDWRKATPSVINRTLVVRCHDHFFLLMNFKMVGNLVFLATRSNVLSPFLQQLIKATPLLFYRHSNTFI